MSEDLKTLCKQVSHINIKCVDKTSFLRMIRRQAWEEIYLFPKEDPFFVSSPNCYFKNPWVGCICIAMVINKDKDIEFYLPFISSAEDLGKISQYTSKIKGGIYLYLVDRFYAKTLILEHSSDPSVIPDYW